MDIAVNLDALRGKFSDCLTVAFADISTGMVLSASSQDHLHQEHLDALCATASEMLCGETARRISSVLSTDDGSNIQQAVIFEAQEVGVFIKSVNSPTDALCCACLPKIDLVDFLTQARKHFADVEHCLIEQGNS